MGHRKKPGAPGKTTIPSEIVASVTERLASMFRKMDFEFDHHLFVVPQQCYLYMEVERKRFPHNDRPRTLPIGKGSTTHRPLGRLKFMGRPDKWAYQPYIWSDECWEEHDGHTGTAEDHMMEILAYKIG
ncbi:MAG: hypothetical protein HY608_04065 [Planctomycetes bacterium]|nr:hypothetical protein [Planctomycetota bacterium]